MAFSTFTIMCNYHFYSSTRTFSLPQRETWHRIRQSLPILLFPQVLANYNLLLVTVDLPIVGNSYKWNHTIAGLLVLASVFLELRAMKKPKGAQVKGRLAVHLGIGKGKTRIFCLQPQAPFRYLVVKVLPCCCRPQAWHGHLHQSSERWVWGQAHCQIQGRLGQQVLGKQSFELAESSWMPCAVYPYMTQWSPVIGAALGQTFTGKANQTGPAMAFGKTERPLMCVASELHGQLNHSQGKSCLSTKGHGHDLSVILCQYVFLTKCHIESPLYGLSHCLHTQGWEPKNLWAGPVKCTI